MHPATAACAVALCLFSAQTAVSQTPAASADLPASLDRTVLTNWLRRNSDLEPVNVISVSPANIIGLMDVTRLETPNAQRQYRTHIRAEVISAQTIREAGNSSWAAEVDVDCQTRKGKVNRIIDFPLRNMKGPPREAGGSAEWVTPPMGTHLFTVVGAVCDGAFERPLGGVQPAAAPPPRSPAPAPVQTATTAPQPQQQVQVQPRPQPPAPLAQSAPAPVAPPRPQTQAQQTIIQTAPRAPAAPPVQPSAPRDRKSTRLNSSHMPVSRMPSSA